MRNYFKSLLFMICLGFYYHGFTQIYITNLTKVYTQNFDSLGIRDSNPWINNKTLPGWYYIILENKTKPRTPLFIAASDGSLSTPFPYHFGEIDSSDRALGSIAGDFLNDNVEHFFGAYFINNTQQTITSVTISYTGEQWRDNATKETFLQLYYRIGGEDFMAGMDHEGWSYGYDYLGYNGPRLSKTGAIDGNDPANQVNIHYQMKDLKIPPGESFWIRWYDRDDTDVDDHGLAIDDFAISFSAVSSNH